VTQAGIGVEMPHVPAELAVPQVGETTVSAVGAAAKQAGEALAGTVAAKGGARVGQQIAEALATGQLDTSDIDPILRQFNIGLPELADDLLRSFSRAGRELQVASSVKRFLTEKAAADPEAALALERLGGIADKASPIARFARGLDDFRRGLVTTQLATAVRNAASQSGRITLDAFDQGLEAIVSGQGPREAGRRVSTIAGAGMREALEESTRFLGRLQPAQMGALQRVLDSNELAARRLLGSPAGNLVLTNKIARALNVFNGIQENYFRRVGFDGSLRNRLRAAGVDVAEAYANPRIIPNDMMQAAVDDGLRLTFANEPEGRLGHGIMRAWRATRPIATLINPFPRFQANATKFLMDFNPGGVLRLLSRSGREHGTKALSEAYIGTLMMGGALALRNSEFAGEKWHEVKVGDKRIDIRAFAPFAQYAFFAETLKQMSERGPDPRNWTLTGRDLAQALLSINRIAGSGLSLLDIATGRSNFDTATDQLVDVAAQYMSGFTVPFVTLKDVIASGAVSSPERALEAAKLRDTRTTVRLPEDFDLGQSARAVGEALTTPARANVPGLAEQLPEKPSLFERRPLAAESPGLRQLTGLSLQTRSPIHAEVNRLGIAFADIAPRTGIPEADREITRHMGAIIEDLAPRVLGSPAYAGQPDDLRKILIERVFSTARTIGRARLAATRPALAAAVRRRGLDRDLSQALTTRGLLPSEADILEGDVP